MDFETKDIGVEAFPKPYGGLDGHGTSPHGRCEESPESSEVSSLGKLSVFSKSPMGTLGTSFITVLEPNHRGGFLDNQEMGLYIYVLDVTEAMMDIEMKIKGLVVDPISKMPIVVLEDPNSEHMLPIWIGVFEANAIALKMENISTPRPMTHDLLRNLLERFDIPVEKIVVNDVRDNTFYATIFCKYNNDIYAIDSRPSDAIALALRMDVPIFVNEDVVKKAHSLKFDEDLEDSEKLKKWLENLRPEDFGKYKM